MAIMQVFENSGCTRRKLLSMAGLLLILSVLGNGIAFAQDPAQLDAAAQEAYKLGNFERAAELSKQVYELKKKMLGPDEFELVTSSLNVGVSLLHAGSHAEAIGYLETACAGAVKHFGNDNPNIGSCLLDLAAAYAGAGQILQAEDAAVRALSVIKAAYPLDGYGAALFHAGEIFRDTEQYSRALQYFSLAAQIYETQGENPGYLATALSEIGQIYYKLSRFDEAVSALERALAIQRRAFGPLDASPLSTAYLLAACYQKIGQFDTALVLLKEIAAGLAGINVAGHVDAEDLLLEIADLQNRNGGVVDAVNTVGLVLQRLTRKDLDNAGSQKVRALTLLGEIHAVQQSFLEAEANFEEAIKAAEKVAHDKPSLQHALERLGFYFLRRGRYAEARARIEEAVVIAQQIEGGDSFSVADLLEKAAIALINGNDCERALPLIERAKAIYGKRQPRSYEMVRVLKMASICSGDETLRSQSMSEALELQQGIEENVSAEFLLDKTRVHLDNDRLADALLTVQQALSLDESSAVARDLLSQILEKQGKSSEAVALLQEAIQVSAEHYGPDSMNVAARQFNLGHILIRMGEKERARGAFMAAAKNFANHTRQLFNSLSLAEQRQLLPQQAASQVSGILAVCQDNACITDGYQLMLSWKGLLVDGLRRQAEIARAMDATSDDAISTRWRTVRSQLAQWTNARGARPYSDWKRKSDALAAEKESLERKLLLAEFGESVGANILLEDLRHVLRADEVFIDVYKFSDFGKEPSSEDIYGAILVGKNYGPSFVRLGTSTDLDATVATWRNSISQESEQPWRKVSTRLWEPLRRVLPAATRSIRVSPDGELTKIPWHRIALSAETALLEVTEVDSARALVRARLRVFGKVERPQLLVAGGIDYDAGRTKRSLTPLGSPFKELRWAKRESKTVAALAQARGMEVIWLNEDRATKPAVLHSMESAQFILLATHAFIGGASEPSFDDSDREFFVGEEHRWGRNVLVESGIALSGANVKDEEGLVADGILTAEEVLDASLGNAELVVLSACSTGLGAETEGQGLLGLRSAFLAAGARKLIVSLWNVNDKATQILMSTFYRSLWHEGKSVVASLQEAQEQVRRRREFRAPKYWAGWIVVDPG